MANRARKQVASTETWTEGFSEWVTDARPGSFFLDTNKTLSVMTYFGHRSIQDESLKLALLHRDRTVRLNVERNKRIICALWRSVAYLIVGMVATAVVA